jgi:hypothetical protein
MHVPVSTATELSSPLPESSPLLPLLDDPLLEELLPEEPLLEELLLEGPPLEELLPEEPLLEELLLEGPPLEELPPEPPPDEPPLDIPPLEVPGFEVPGELVLQAESRGAAASAKLQMRTDRAFMPGVQAIPMPCARIAGNALTMGVKTQCRLDIAV